MSMPAHSAPVGIAVYRHPGTCLPEGCRPGAFPVEWDGHAFVSFHGSWNKDDPTGCKVVRIPMSADGEVSSLDPLDVFWHGGSGARWPSGLRPVHLKFDLCGPGRLLFTSDGTSASNSDGQMVMLQHHPPSEPPTDASLDTAPTGLYSAPNTTSSTSPSLHSTAAPLSSACAGAVQQQRLRRRRRRQQQRVWVDRADGFSSASHCDHTGRNPPGQAASPGIAGRPSRHTKSPGSKVRHVCW